METLLVGAGAVGQVLGLHLARGGARVSLLVKPAHAAEAARGFTLHPLRGRRRPVEFLPDAVLTSMQEVAAKKWDAIILCVSSTALRGGSWLAELGRAAGSATVAAVQPGLDDPEVVAAQVPIGQLVWGMFGLVSFASADVGPAPAIDPPGTAYWLPPLTKLPWSGHPARARAIAETLSRGGLPSRVRADVPREMAFGAAALDLHMVALECAGWRFAALRGDRALLDDTRGALGEALALVARRLGGRAPWLLARLRPWMIRLALRLIPRLTPFDAETYLRVHYTKVGEQTALQLATYVSLAREAGLPTDALSKLAARLQAGRAAAPAEDDHHRRSA